MELSMCSRFLRHATFGPTSLEISTLVGNDGVPLEDAMAAWVAAQADMVSAHLPVQCAVVVSSSIVLAAVLRSQPCTEPTCASDRIHVCDCGALAATTCSPGFHLLVKLDHGGTQQLSHGTTNPRIWRCMPMLLAASTC